jgi:hypothetical protein
MAVGDGPRLRARIGELLGAQRSSRSAVQAFCRSILGLAISRGAMQRVVDRVLAAIHPQYERLAEVARQSRGTHVDETTWSHQGILAWLWVRVHTTGAFFRVTVQVPKIRLVTPVGYAV